MPFDGIAMMGLTHAAATRTEDEMKKLVLEHHPQFDEATATDIAKAAIRLAKAD
jgi:hypothetical protein